MFYNNNLIEMIYNIIKYIVTLSTSKYSYVGLQKYALYIKFSITIYNVILVSILLLIIINTLFNYFFPQNNFLKNVVKYLNFLLTCLLILLIVAKFVVALKVENVIGGSIYDLKLAFFKENTNLGYMEIFATLTTAFGDAVLLLAVIIGLLCVDLLGSKNLLHNISNMNVFYFFIFFVTTMVTTNNLLVLFISFEFIFFPTVYFAYVLGYSKKIDKSIQILFYWTLFGSFLVLCTLSYVYVQKNTLNYMFLNKSNFSDSELTFFLVNIFLGFSVKIPLVPFHFWLLKVHVESPTAFSIFLSGFLVKSAVYCLFMLLSIFYNNRIYLFLFMWTLYSLIAGTLGLSRQTDIKKLIAWATIQEMSFILTFLILKHMFLNHVWVIFVVLHGLMSAYMFFFIDMLQRRYKTRSFQSVQGLNLITPKLTKYVWFLVFLFSGFPLTVKFFIEWDLTSLLLETEKFVTLLVLIIVNVLGTLFFCKIMFSTIYGTKTLNVNKNDFMDVQKKEEAILNYLSFLIIWLIFLIFII